MSLKLKCPNPACGKSYSVSQEHVGRTTRCPACRREMTIGDPSLVAAPKGATDFKPGSGDTLRATASQQETQVAAERIGRFEIKEQLGAGAFGEVYRAYDRTLDREVALKVPKAATVGSTRALDRFLREGKAAAQLRHPHIVPVYDAGQADGKYYIASAFINGKPLSELIEDAANNPLPSRERAVGRQAEASQQVAAQPLGEGAGSGLDFHRTATIVRALAEALSYAHEQRIVHRDIKPDNVMIDQAGQPHLMDFGLARFAESADKMTQDGTVLGTASYMAPEQARGDLENVGPLSDQYSLGVVLYELLTGQTPFSGPPQVVLFHVLETEPPAPHTVRKDIPLDLETICLRAMAKEPSRRYPDCRALSEDLRRFLENEPIAARRLRPTERLIRWCRRNPVVSGLTVALFLALALGVVASGLFAAQSRRRAVLAQQEAARADIEAQAARAAEAKLTQEADALRAAEAKAAAEARRAEKEAQAAREAERQRATEAKAARAAEAKAETEAQAAREAESRADAEAKRAGQRAYYVSMLLAQSEWERNNMPRFLNLLDSHRPAAGGGDLRGFEWFYWWDQAHRGHTRRMHDQGLPSPREVVFTPDGSQVIYSFSDGAIAVFDAQSRRQIVAMEGTNSGRDYCQAIALSPDGKALAALFAENRVQAWDVDSGKRRFSITAQVKRVMNMDFSPDSKQILVSGDYGQDVRNWGAEIELWNANTGKQIRRTELKDAHAAVTFSSDGSRHIAVGRGPELMVFDEKGKRQRTLAMSRVHSLAVHALRKRLATGHEDGTVRLWDDARFEEVCVLRGHVGAVRKLVFSSDGTHLASLGRDGSIRIWFCGSLDPMYTVWGGGSETHELKMHSGAVQSLSLNPHGEQLVALDGSGGEEAWDLSRTARTVEFDGHEAIAFSPDGRSVAAGAYGPPMGNVRNAGLSVKLWDLATGKERFCLDGHTERIACIAFSKDGARLASGGADKTVKVWDVKSGQEICTYQGHKGFVKQLAFSPDGQRIASGEDAEVRVWNAQSGADLFVIPDRGAKAISQDGRWLDNKGGVHAAHIWDDAGGGEVVALTKPFPDNAAFSLDSRRIAGVTGQGVKIWDAQTGAEIATCTGVKSVQGIAFSPDGRRLACSGGNDIVRLWDTATGQDVFSLTRKYDQPGKNAGRLAFSPDGRRLAVVQSTRLHIWDAPEATEPKTEPGISRP